MARGQKVACVVEQDNFVDTIVNHELHFEELLKTRHIFSIK